MKHWLALLCLGLCYGGFGQAIKQDLTRSFASPERKDMLYAIKKAVQPELKLMPSMVVKRLVVKDGFACFTGRVKDNAGRDIDFTKTAYKQAVKDGVFDGDGTVALLKKMGKAWTVLAYAIGPTDVPWGCWWKQYKAPKEIFDYTEDACNWVNQKK